MTSTLVLERAAPHWQVRIRRYPAGHAMDRHCHDDHSITTILDGELVEESDHQVVVARAGWTVNKPHGTYHSNRFGPNGALLLAVTVPPDVASVGQHSWSWVESPTVAGAAFRLLAMPGDHAHSARLVSALIATMASASAHCRDRGWTDAVKLTLDAELREPASIARLAVSAGVHPVYMARVFRAAFGMSIREYRTLLRVRRALASIASTDEPLSSVAQRHGFSDQSHMCRAFRSLLDATPGDVRRTRTSRFQSFNT